MSNERVFGLGALTVYKSCNILMPGCVQSPTMSNVRSLRSHVKPYLDCTDLYTQNRLELAIIGYILRQYPIENRVEEDTNK